MRFTTITRPVGTKNVGDVLLDGVFFAQAKSAEVADRVANYLEKCQAYDYESFTQNVSNAAKLSLISATNIVPLESYQRVKIHLHKMAR